MTASSRELKPGARPVDASPGILTSPCDGIVGACGRDRRHAVVPGERLRLHARGSLEGFAAGRAVPERLLRHAAAYRRHVSPLPRAVRLRDRRGDVRVRRYVERESDRAEANRAALLQERARCRSIAAPRRRANRPFWCPSPRSWWRASTSSSSTCRSTCGIAGRTGLPAARPRGRATSWGTSAMDPPSSLSAPVVCRCARTCTRAPASRRASRCSGICKGFGPTPRLAQATTRRFVTPESSAVRSDVTSAWNSASVATAQDRASVTREQRRAGEREARTWEIGHESRHLHRQRLREGQWRDDDAAGRARTCAR